MSRPPDHKKPAAEPWSGFDSYAQLCRALLPGAHVVAIFDARGALRWSTDSAAASDITPIIAGALAAPDASFESTGACYMLPSNVPAYVCWIRDNSRHLLAAATVACSPAGERTTEPRSFQLVHTVLAPVLECLRRDLLARVAVGKLKRTVAELNKMRRGAAITICWP